MFLDEFAFGGSNWFTKSNHNNGPPEYFMLNGFESFKLLQPPSANLTIQEKRRRMMAGGLAMILEPPFEPTSSSSSSSSSLSSGSGIHQQDFVMKKDDDAKDREVKLWNRFFSNVSSVIFDNNMVDDWLNRISSLRYLNRAAQAKDSNNSAGRSKNMNHHHHQHSLPQAHRMPTSLDESNRHKKKVESNMRALIGRPHHQSHQQFNSNRGRGAAMNKHASHNININNKRYGDSRSNRKKDDDNASTSSSSTTMTTQNSRSSSGLFHFFTKITNDAISALATAYVYGGAGLFPIDDPEFTTSSSPSDDHQEKQVNIDDAVVVVEDIVEDDNSRKAESAVEEVEEEVEKEVVPWTSKFSKFFEFVDFLVDAYTHFYIMTVAFS
jgi:hypothetical protein